MAGLFPAVYVPTKRGGQALVIEGFTYHFWENRNGNGRMIYKCAERSHGCKGRATVRDDMVLSYSLAELHTHAPDEALPKAMEIRDSLKQQAAESPFQPISEMHREAIAKVLDEEDPAGILQHLSSPKSMQNIMSAARMKNFPKLSSDREKLVLPQDFDSYRGEKFILFNDGTKDRIIGFGSPSNIRRLAAAKVVHMDGTFSSAPKQFKQLYIIGIVENQGFVPLLFGLLPDKRGATYARFFRLVSEQCDAEGLKFAPERIIVDFEKAVLFNLKLLFPQSRIAGCNFHFQSAIWRKIQELGLVKRYREDPKTKIWVRMVTALAFLPPDKVLDGWNDMLPYKPGTHLDLFVEYMERVWIGEEYGDGMFERIIWNVWDHIYDSRTNNHMEGYNSCFVKTVRVKHPNMYKLMQKIGKEFDYYNALRMQNLQPKRKRQRRANYEELLREKVEKFKKDLDYDDYLHSVGRLNYFMLERSS